MPDEGLDALPVEQRARRRAASQSPRQTSAQRAAQADVYAHNAPGALSESQLDIAGSGQSSAGDVDQPVPENVLTQEHLAAAALETAEVELISGELDSARLEHGDHLGGDEEIAPGHVRLEPRYRRICAIGQPDDHVFYTGEVLDGAIDQLTSGEHW